MEQEIIFFCEASVEKGFGHAGRCLALAAALRDEHSCQCSFAFRGDDLAAGKIKQAGFKVHQTTDFNRWEFSTGQTAVLDLREQLSRTFFDAARNRNILICTLDDPTSNRLHCDLAFYPPVPQVTEMDWSCFSGRLYHGWDYIPLRKEFKQIREFPQKVNNNQLLITMGGSDPKGLTLRILRIFKKISSHWNTVVIVGAMCADFEKINKMAEASKNRITVLSSVAEMAEIMAKSELAIASFGMTAYELAACATPQILLCLSADHARSAGALHIAGAAISSGESGHVSDKELQTVITGILNDPEQRQQMRTAASGLNVAEGASNIARIIYEERSKNRV